jgi:hypothetical protein
MPFCFKKWYWNDLFALRWIDIWSWTFQIVGQFAWTNNGQNNRFQISTWSWTFQIVAGFAAVRTCSIVLKRRAKSRGTFIYIFKMELARLGSRFIRKNCGSVLDATGPEWQQQQPTNRTRLVDFHRFIEKVVARCREIWVHHKKY